MDEDVDSKRSSDLSQITQLVKRGTRLEPSWEVGIYFVKFFWWNPFVGGEVRTPATEDPFALAPGRSLHRKETLKEVPGPDGQGGCGPRTFTTHLSHVLHLV